MSEEASSLRLLGRDYWIAWSTPSPGVTREDILERLPEHLAWLRQLELQGTLVLSGPLPDQPPGAGLTVLRADGADSARTTMAADPFVIAGLRSAEVYRWRVNEGLIGITVSLATGTFEWQ